MITGLIVKINYLREKNMFLYGMNISDMAITIVCGTYGLAYYHSDYQMWFGEDLNGANVKVLAWQPLPTLPSKYRNEMENEYEQIE